MVEYGIDGDRSLARLPVADDEFALSPADGDHAVDGEDSRLQRFVDLCPVHNGGSGIFDGAVFFRLDFRQPVERLTERVDDSPQKFLSHTHLNCFARGICKIAVSDFIFARKQNGADLIALQVEREGAVSALNFEKFVVFNIPQTRDMHDPVARINDSAASAFVRIFAHGIQFFADPSSYRINVNHSTPCACGVITNV